VMEQGPEDGSPPSPRSMFVWLRDSGDVGFGHAGTDDGYDGRALFTRSFQMSFEPTARPQDPGGPLAVQPDNRLAGQVRSRPPVQPRFASSKDQIVASMVIP
jgi:hypothetical protein